VLTRWFPGFGSGKGMKPRCWPPTFWHSAERSASALLVHEVEVLATAKTRVYRAS